MKGYQLLAVMPFLALAISAVLKWLVSFFTEVNYAKKVYFFSAGLFFQIPFLALNKHWIFLTILLVAFVFSIIIASGMEKIESVDLADLT